MQNYDVTLKLLLQGSARRTVQELTGTRIKEWLNVELPKVRNRRADLLAHAEDGSLIHMELQSTNDPEMGFRMFGYCGDILTARRQFPRQIVLYVGQPKLRMPTELRGPDQYLRYRAVDIRELDSDRLLESEDAGDLVIAILARLQDNKKAVRRIVSRIAELKPHQRRAAMAQLLILAGLRHLEETVEQEARSMPIHIDIMENKVVAREYRRGLQEGKLEGIEEGEIALLRRLIEERFGTVPGWVEKRLSGSSAEELIEIGARVLRARSLKDLFQG